MLHLNNNRKLKLLLNNVFPQWLIQQDWVGFARAPGLQTLATFLHSAQGVSQSLLIQQFT